MAAGLTLTGLGLLAAVPAGAADWPAWRGADRSGVSPETGLLKTWPAGGPKLLWKAAGMGEGYGEPAVVGDRIYLTGNNGMDNEFVQALSAKDGSSLWVTRLGKVGPNTSAPYPGARSTPTVDGDVLYALGSDGDLVGVETAAGKERWRKSLRADFGGKPGVWAYAESPLIDGDALVCTPGGSETSMAALNKKTGAVIWKAHVPDAGEAAYASPIAAEAGGTRQYIQFLRNGVVSVAAKDGTLLWRYTKLATPTNCCTPIVRGDRVFISMAGPGGAGHALLKLAADGKGVSVVYEGKDLAVHHGGVVLVGDALFGATNSVLACLDFATGAKKWDHRSVGKGSVAAADGRLYVRSERGPIALVEATPAGYREAGQFDQPDRSGKNAWPHPVISGGRLYIRDWDVLLCYDIKAR
jgi:outer membrane protein assembly factor BamB